jgi:hypothetical protein
MLLSLLAGCGGGDFSASPSGPAVISTGQQQELTPLPAIVFDDMIEDPFVAMVGDAEGKAVLRLTLFETAPGVYSGDGAMERSTSMGGEEPIFSDIYYRVNFRDLKPDAPGQCEIPAFNISGQSSAWGGDEELGRYNILVRSNRQIPAEYELTASGDTARLRLTIAAFEFVFTGSVTRAEPVSPKSDRLDGRCISINSIFYENGKSYNH